MRAPTSLKEGHDRGRVSEPRGKARRGGSAPNSGPKFLARRQSTIGIGGKLALSSLYVLPVAYLSSSSSAQRSFLSSFAA